MPPLNPSEWATGSTARLFDVPWDSSYKDVVWWDVAHRDAYFEQHALASWTIERMQYLRAGEAVTVPIPYDDCWRANYLVVDNARAPFAESEPVTLCYFIESVTYQAPNATLLTLQLDVWQTFALTMSVGSCYVERGHVVAAAAAHAPEGVTSPRVAQRYYMEPEGLDVGNDYVVSRHFYHDLSNLAGAGLGVLVSATADLEADWGTLDSPNLDTAASHVVDGLPSGAGLYLFTAQQFTDFMTKVKGYPWISKSITLCVGVPAGIVQGIDVSLGGIAAKRVQSDAMVSLGPDSWATEDGFRNIYDSMGGLEKFAKFNTYPYTYYEVDTNNGSPVLLKPELCVPNGYLTFNLVTVVVPPHLRIAIVPQRYGLNADDSLVNDPSTQTYEYVTYSGGGSRTLNAGQNLGVAAWIQSFPQFALVNDEYLNYLVSTQNTREAQYAGAGWAQQKSNASARLGYNQALTNMSNNYANNQLRNQQVQNSMLGSIGNTALGALGALATGNVGGALSGVAGGVINTAVTAANNDLTNQQFHNNQTTAITLAGQNLGLAQWSAQGDYEQTIRSINATVQDAALTQPSMSGQVGGEGFNLASGNFGYNVRVMTVNPARARAIADYWQRYGYACNRYVTIGANLQLMSRYTYWKCADVYVTDWQGDEGTKNVVRGIMERGVTVWKDPREIGRIGLGYDNGADLTIGALY